MTRLNHYWSLAGFYGFYFASLGIWLPYWPLYMSHLGHGPEAIGLVTSLSMAVKLLGPPVWGRMADRGDARKSIIQITSTGAFLATCTFFLESGFPFFLIMVVLFHFFHVGTIGLTETTTMESVSRHGWDYGRIRLWGSAGFILLALGLGPLTDHVGLMLVPASLCLFLGLQTMITFGIPKPEPKGAPPGRPITPLFALREIRWFYLTALMMQLSHGAYYGFMSLYLEQNGFSNTVIGALWSLGVLAEIGILSISNLILNRFGVSLVLVISLLLAAVRWLIFSLTLAWPLLILGQLLHAFTFGTFHIAAIRRVHEMAPHSLRATAQSWFSAISYGAGLGLGLLVSGTLFDRIGAESLFAIMSTFALLGALAARHQALLFEKAHSHDRT